MATVERLSYFQFYPADYLLDTNDLSLAQHGAYLSLMLRYYWQGGLAVSDIYRGCRSDTDRADVEFVVARYFHYEGEKIQHHRIDRELAKIARFVEHQSKAGKASVAARAAIKNAEQNPSSGNGEDKSVVEMLPLKSGEHFAVTEALAKELDPLYPAVDVRPTLREMKGWLTGNPDRRKTKRGIRKFICGWLQREQEKHGS